MLNLKIDVGFIVMSILVIAVAFAGYQFGRNVELQRKDVFRIENRQLSNFNKRIHGYLSAVAKTDSTGNIKKGAAQLGIELQ